MEIRPRLIDPTAPEDVEKIDHGHIPLVHSSRDVSRDYECTISLHLHDASDDLFGRMTVPWLLAWVPIALVHLLQLLPAGNLNVALR